MVHLMLCEVTSIKKKKKKAGENEDWDNLKPWEVNYSIPDII